MSAELDPDVRALLTALHDALDIPMPEITDQGERFYHQVLASRASVVKHALRGVLEGMQQPAAVAFVSDWVADSPVTYEPWAPGDES